LAENVDGTIAGFFLDFLFANAKDVDSACALFFFCLFDALAENVVGSVTVVGFFSLVNTVSKDVSFFTVRNNNDLLSFSKNLDVESVGDISIINIVIV